MLVRTAPAKINLALHVTGKREDGYHLLDSLVKFSDYGDRITLQERSDNKPHVLLEISGPFAKGLAADEDNLVMRAAIMLSEAAAHNDIETRSVRITLEKNLPVASGIGGGSADAAATIMALKEFWRIGSEVDLFAIASELGADVSMCLHSVPLRARGIGEEITPLKAKWPMHMVLVNPLKPVLTSQVFAACANTDNPPMQIGSSGTFPAIDRICTMRNDLQDAACEVEPEITHVLNMIKSTGSMLTRMSGSGATCFGVYQTPDIAERARDIIARRMPEWWCIATSTLTG